VVSRTVTLDERAVQGLRASFRAAMKRDPQTAELADLVQEAVGEEILFREGLARGLDRDDGVVRRRVIEKMTALVHPSAPTSDPSREELRRWFETYRHRFLRPAAVTFDQLFFDARRRSAAGADAPAAALAALKSLQQAPPDGRRMSSADKTRLVRAGLLVLGVGAVFAATSVDLVVIGIALAVVGLPVAVWAFVRLVPAGTVRLERGLPSVVGVRGLLTWAFFGCDAYVSLAVTEGLGGSTLLAGLVLTATSITWTAGSWVQERWIERVGPRRLDVIGFHAAHSGHEQRHARRQHRFGCTVACMDGSKKQGMRP